MKANWLIFLMLFAYSGSAYAIGVGAPAQPAWWVSLLLSGGMLVISGYIKGVKDDAREMQKDIQDIKLSMVRDYHPKPEIEKQLVELKALIHELKDTIEDLR